jgi:4-amino-4-deoxy-L-arabinose transferase-like glycosyltransferase
MPSVSAPSRLGSLPHTLFFCIAILSAGFLIAHVAIGLTTLRNPQYLVRISFPMVLAGAPLAFGLYALGVFIMAVRRSPGNRLALFTAAFWLRVVVGVILAFVFQYDDERGFHATGQAQTYGLFSWTASAGYYNLVNILYTIFGESLLLPKIMNAFLGALLPFLAYDLGRRLFDDVKAGERALLFTAFLPVLVVFSAVNLKEIGTAFLLVLALWSLVCLQHGMWRITGVALTLGLLYWLRGAPWTALVLVGVITYLLASRRAQDGLQLRVRSRMKTLLLGAIIICCFLPGVLTPLTQMVTSRLTEEEYFINRFTGSSATVMQFVDVSNPLSPQNLSLLFLRGLYSPSPLRFVFDRGLEPSIEGLNMAIWYLLFPLAVVGAIHYRDRSAVLTCTVMVLSVLLLVTTGIMVGADPARHRPTLLGLLFVLSAGGLQKEAFHRRRWVLYLWWLGALLFTLLWIAFRL